MIDKHESDALALLAALEAHTLREQSVALLESALRSARAEAFEEAAKIAETTPDSGIPTMDDVENDHAHKIAAAIRAAKDQETR